ncbi:thiaminase II [Nonomuraea sp. NBC_01738]|uniref:thiaminase II n=1 Tax=Nonomuraea sp. NBC_01738 TaxID=2976003 RepID=UPI002E110B60|nr:thiaminase II [Nonomuraea sp. NBC_01738]
MSRLRDELWQVVAGIYDQVLAHPFLTGLTDGSLPREAFRHYVVQEAHFLPDYARAQAACAARAPEAAAVRRFARDAVTTVEVEHSLVVELLAAFGLGETEARNLPAAPTTVGYASYLVRNCALGTFPEALGALLPCYMIYARVGEALLARSSPDPLYAWWIETYGGEGYQETTAGALDLLDELTPGPGERERMLDRALTTARYEWLFWDAAWRREGWPCG